MGTDKRHMLIYALIAGGPAALGPFAASWLHARGVGYGSLGLALAAPLLLRAVLCRPLAAAGDRCSSPWTAVSLLIGVASLASTLCALVPGVDLAVVAWWSLCLSANMCMPLMDAAILAASPGGEASATLSRIKGVGALGYFLAVSALGFALAQVGHLALPLWAIVTGCLACFGAGRLSRVSPALAKSDPGRPASPGPIPQQKGGVALMLAAAIAIELSHGLQSVAMLHWAERGIPSGLNGILWATGTLADIVFLWLGGGMMKRMTPSTLLAIAGAAAVLRWVGFAMDPPLPALFGLQALHALSFTATCLATVHYTHRYVGSGSGAQLVTWGSSTGLAGGLAVFGGSFVYGALGTDGYWIMASLAGIGLIAALRLRRNEQSGGAVRGALSAALGPAPSMRGA